MSYNETQNQVLALAGIFQACALVKNIAWTGRYGNASAQASLSSILKINSIDLDDIYGDIASLKLGLQHLMTELHGGKEKPDLEITRYAVTLLHLQKRLMKNRDMVTLLDKGITAINAQLAQYDINHANTIAKLADLYQKTVSTIEPRILVNGEHIHLSNTDNANRIRSLLLAGIRSAVLFKQCKGSKIKLLFNRRKYINTAEELLRIFTK